VQLLVSEQYIDSIMHGTTLKKKPQSLVSHRTCYGRCNAQALRHEPRISWTRTKQSIPSQTLFLWETTTF